MTEFVAAHGLAKVTLYSRQVPDGNHVDNFFIPWPSEPSEEVFIGGGVMGSNNPGKFVTASYPDPYLAGWHVAARDHLTDDTKGATGFALGLQFYYPDKLTPINAADIMPFVYLDAVTSSPFKEHPQAFAPVWPGAIVVGGGFKVNADEPGSLGTGSHPDTAMEHDPDAEGRQVGDTRVGDNTGWRAEAQSHLVSCPGTVTTYCISIANPMGPFFFPLTQEWFMYHLGFGEGNPKTSASLGHTQEETTVPDGLALVSGGAQVEESPGGAGNMLWQMQPVSHDGNSPWGFRAQSKDHLVADPARIQVWAYGIDPTASKVPGP